MLRAWALLLATAIACADDAAAVPSSKRGLQTASKSSASHYNAYRLKLSGAFCPSASEAEKSLLACRNFELSKKLKSASDDTKKALLDEKKKLYAAAAAKPEEEKKASLAAHRAMFTKAFAAYCPSRPTDEACTNELMKKLYSGEKKTPSAAKKVSGATMRKRSKKM